MKNHKDPLTKVQDGIADTSKKIQEGFSDTTREIWLAGLGVLSAVEEEGVKLYNRFVEKGEELVEKGKEFEKKDKEKGVSSKIGETAKFVEDKLKSAVERIDISSRNEMNELNDKVDKLTDAVAALAKKIDKK